MELHLGPEYRRQTSELSQCLPCFSASIVTGFRSLSRRCLNRLCSTSNCCSPATSIASILRSGGKKEMVEGDRNHYHVQQLHLPRRGNSSPTYRHRACEGRWRRCWFSVCPLATCRRTAQDEPAGKQQHERKILIRTFSLKHKHVEM